MPNCLDGLSGNWYSLSDGTPILQCLTTCLNNQIVPSESIALLVDPVSSSSSNGGIKFKYDLGSSSVQYGVIGVDVLYYSDGDAQLNIDINSYINYTFNPLSITLYEDTYTITCGSKSQKLKKASLSLHRGSTPLLNNQIVINFDKVSAQLPSSTNLGLKRINVWMSCSLNCSVCSTQDSCSVCKSGYKSHRLSSGDIVCEQTTGCSANCYSCILNSMENICIECAPGYALSSNTCSIPPSLFTCPLDPFCYGYSTQCLVYNAITSTYQSCGSIEDYTSYRCPNYQFILLSGEQNYESYRCGCDVSDCKECIYSGQCMSCSPGYTMPSSSSCLSQCASNQYYNPTQNLCVDCAIGTNCLQCDSNSCLKCTDLSYYIDQTSPQNCNKCLINNCQECSSDGNCKICNEYYELNAISSACLAECGVSNCQECQIGSTNQCQTCETLYTLNTTTNQCIMCQPNEILLPDFTCIPSNTCLVPNCAQCITNDPLHCDKCNINYSHSLDSSSCLNCSVTNCSSCQASNYQKCQLCVNNYYLSADKLSCNLCAVPYCKNCEDTNYQLCNSCSYNFFLTLDKSECKSCQISNCQQCDSTYNKCLTCNSNFYPTLDKSECKSCQVSNCQQCDQSYSKCLTCNSNLYLSLDQSECKNCSVSNCSLCSTINYEICQTCNALFYLNENQTQCLQCNVTNCSECVSSNYLMCAKCNAQYSLSADQTQCNQIIIPSSQKNKFSLQQSVVDNGYEVKIVFANALQNINMTQVKLLQIFDLEITKVSKSNYDFTLEQISNTVILLTILPRINIKASSIDINICDDQFVCQNQIENKKANEMLSPYVKVSQQEKRAAEQMSAIGKGVSTSIFSSIIPTLFVGNFYVICNTLDITGFLYYLIFLDIRYPINIIKFFELFKDFSFPFIPNLFKYFYNPDYVQKSPPKFMQMNTDNYFIHNSGQFFTIILAGIGLYAIAKILAVSPLKYLNSYCYRAVRETWEFSGFIDLIWSVYIYLVVGVLMQFNTFNFDDNNSYLVNYIIHSISTIIIFALPFFLFYIIYTQRNIQNKEFITKYSTLLNGLKLPPLLNQDEQPKNNCGGDKTFNNQNDKINNQNEKTINNQNDKESNTTFSKRFEKELDYPLSQSQQKNSNKDKETTVNLDCQKREYYVKNGASRRKRTRLISALYESSEMRMKSLSLSSSSLILNEVSFTREQIIYRISKYYNILLYFRKIIFSIIITFLYQQPYLQIVLISVLNVIIISFLAYAKPFSNMLDNIQFIIQEVSLIVIQICASLLVKDDSEQNENDRMLIGWIIVGISASLIIYFTFFIFKDLFSPLFSLLKKSIIYIKSKLSKINKKVHPNVTNQRNDEEKIQIENMQANNMQDDLTQNLQYSSIFKPAIQQFNSQQQMLSSKRSFTKRNYSTRLSIISAFSKSTSASILQHDPHSRPSQDLSKQQQQIIDYQQQSQDFFKKIGQNSPDTQRKSQQFTQYQSADRNG